MSKKKKLLKNKTNFEIILHKPVMQELTKKNNKKNKNQNAWTLQKRIKTRKTSSRIHPQT